MNPEPQFLDRYVGGRGEQEAQIVKAVRGLFDERGLRDPSIGEIAKAVGINKATIYRHVASKEELFLLVLASYQLELDERLRGVDENQDPLARLDQILERYIDFAGRYPGYLDCVAGLQATPFSELATRVSAAVLMHVGMSVGSVNRRFANVIAAGKDEGAFDVDDPEHAAHVAYSAILGVMQALRLGVVVQQTSSGFPEIVPLERETTIRLMLAGVYHTLGAISPDRRGA